MARHGTLSALARRNLVRRIALLPLLVALLYRAAIPVGYMPMVGQNGWLTLELCTSVVAPAAAMPLVAMAAHEHHHHPDTLQGVPQTGHDHGTGDTHTVCPFATTAGPAPLSAKVVPPGAVDALVVDIAFVTASISAPTILRSQRSRAPPAPSLI